MQNLAYQSVCRQITCLAMLLKAWIYCSAILKLAACKQNDNVIPCLLLTSRDSDFFFQVSIMRQFYTPRIYHKNFFSQLYRNTNIFFFFDKHRNTNIINLLPYWVCIWSSVCKNASLILDDLHFSKLILVKNKFEVKWLILGNFYLKRKFTV